MRDVEHRGCSAAFAWPMRLATLSLVLAGCGAATPAVPSVVEAAAGPAPDDGVDVTAHDDEDWMAAYEIWVIGADDECAADVADAAALHQRFVDDLTLLGRQAHLPPPSPDACAYLREALRPAWLDAARAASDEAPIARCLLAHEHAVELWRRAPPYPVPPRTVATETRYDELASNRLIAAGNPRPTPFEASEMIASLEEERFEYEDASEVGITLFYGSTWQGIVEFLARVEAHWPAAATLRSVAERVAQTCPEPPPRDT